MIMCKPGLETADEGTDPPAPVRQHRHPSTPDNAEIELRSSPQNRFKGCFVHIPHESTPSVSEGLSCEFIKGLSSPT
jgi:hypothetical protein